MLLHRPYLSRADFQIVFESETESLQGLLDFGADLTHGDALLDGNLLVGEFSLTACLKNTAGLFRHIPKSLSEEKENFIGIYRVAA